MTYENPTRPDGTGPGAPDADAPAPPGGAPAPSAGATAATPAVRQTQAMLPD